MHEKVVARLEREGLTLPPAPRPVAAYVPAVVVGNLVFSSGQLPIKDGKLVYTGKLPQDLSVEDGYQACRLAALNALAAVAGVVDLDLVQRVVRVGGFVQSAPGFGEQPKVVNGASELLGAVFGDRGQHARAAVGVSELPLNAAVEVEILVSL